MSFEISGVFRKDSSFSILEPISKKVEDIVL